MTLARASRLLLAFAAALIVVWSFFDVGRRAVARWQLRHEKPVTLTVMHWGDQAEDQLVAKLLDKYQRDNPRVQIIRINPGNNDFRYKLKTMMAAGTPPDLFYLPGDILPELATMKLIRPVDDLIKRDVAAGNKATYDDFFPLIVDAFRYDVATGKTGVGPLYGLPKDFTTSVMYVNLDLFERAGVKVPYDGWTWSEYEDACRRITALSDQPEFAGRKIYGGFLQIWPDSLRNVIWTFGGEFFGKDFRDVTLDDSPAQAALEFIRRTRQEGIVFNPSGDIQRGGQEYFTGNIGCIGPIGRWMTPRYSAITNFRWDVVPVPYSEKRNQASMIYYTAWTMSTKTRHVDEAFKLQKYLCGGEGAIEQSHLGLAIPPLKSVAYSKDFLEPPGLPKMRSQIFLDAINYSRIQQLPREQEWTELVKSKIDNSIKLMQSDTLSNARDIERLWLTELDSPLRRKPWSPLRWDVIVALTLAVVATVVAALWVRARKEKLGPLDKATERAGFAFILPWVIGFVALTAGPMVVSLILSFTKWSAMTPMTEALGVGTANYRQMVVADEKFWKSLKVTTWFVVLAVPLSQMAALGVAMLMNTRVRAIAAFRTIYFVPSLIVTSVVGAVLWMQLLNPDWGLINTLLRPFARAMNTAPPDWLGRDAARWAIPAFVMMSLWGVGGAMILYLAGLKGIPISLYEAATIDGAGQLRKFWNVTLPMLSPLIFYNLVMGIIGSFQVFVQAMVMTDGGPDDLTLFYVLNLYNQAFKFHNMGYASALAWVLFLILLGLTALVFRGSKNLVYYEGLKT